MHGLWRGQPIMGEVRGHECPLTIHVSIRATVPKHRRYCYRSQYRKSTPISAEATTVQALSSVQTVSGLQAQEPSSSLFSPSMLGAFPGGTNVPYRKLYLRNWEYKAALNRALDVERISRHSQIYQAQLTAFGNNNSSVPKSVDLAKKR
jgi:hypothetical protein